VARDVERAKGQAFHLYQAAVLDEFALRGYAAAVRGVAEDLEPGKALGQRQIAAHVIAVMVGGENRAERDAELAERAFDGLTLARIDHDGSRGSGREQ
jgi:hypothetical protein